MGQSDNDSGDRPTELAMRGHSIYDGPCGIDGVHFAWFTGKDTAIQTNGAATKSTVHWVRRVTFDDDIPEANKVEFSPATFRGYMWSSGLRDLDGSLTGRIGAVLTPRITPDARVPIQVYEERFNVAENAILKPERAALINQGAHFGLLQLHPFWAKNTAEHVQVTRCGGSQGSCSTVTDVGTFDWYYQNPATVNQGFTYQFSFPKLPAEFSVTIKFVRNNDNVLVKIANVPPQTRSTGSRVNSINELTRASSTSYLLNKGQLWIKLVAGGQVTDKSSTVNQPFGINFSASSSVRVTIPKAAPNDRYNILSVFNGGVDRRCALVAADGATYRGVSSGWDNTINWGDVVSPADGRDAYVDYRLNLMTPQDWSYYQAMTVKTVLAGERSSKPYAYQVLIEDLDQGEISVGRCLTGNCELSLNLLGWNRSEKSDVLDHSSQN